MYGWEGHGRVVVKATLLCGFCQSWSFHKLRVCVAPREFRHESADDTAVAKSRGWGAGWLHGDHCGRAAVEPAEGAGAGRAIRVLALLPVFVVAASKYMQTRLPE